MKLLSVCEAAAFLNVTERMIRRLVHERRLAHYKVGRHVRIDEDDLRSFVQDNRVDAV